MTLFNKIKAFEYLSHEFFKWFQEVNPGVSIEENFSKLKLIKLHFFACAVTSDSLSEGLLAQFDNFYAMPYGHVESSVYEKLGEINTITFERNKVEIKPYPENYFNDIPVEQLNQAIESLKKKNKSIVTYTPIQLVDLSHSWNSWITMYNLARQLNRFSIKIPTKMIQNENKIFILN
ncbi:MAG TPA: hypothetical protein DER09_12750 [Prolixibacteraceae bacterium]|nr:hypothetical protein [Prolixibacteraceae bacterium]